MKRLIVLAVAVSLLALAGAGSALASGAMLQESDVHRFDTGADVGDAALTRTDSGVSMTIKSAVEGELFEVGIGFLSEFFSKGDATTNWWVVFNNPENCAHPLPAFGAKCGEGDVIDAALFGDPNDVKVDVLFATGHVAGNNWRAAAHLSEGDTSGSVLPVLGLDPVGLMDARKAEIHVIVRSHGPAENLVPDELAEAIHSVGGGCATNTCGDAQFAVFSPPMMP